MVHLQTVARIAFVLVGIVSMVSARAASWVTNAPMTVARQFHTATLLNDGRVLVAGGQDDTYQIVASSEVYDPSVDSWSPTGSMTTNRNWHRAVLLPDGKVLVTGGVQTDQALSSTEIYNPTNGNWMLTGTMGSTRWTHTMTLLQNGTVLVAGGYNTDYQVLKSAEVYDPTTGIWTNTGSMNFGHSRHAAVLLPNGKVLVMGGSDDNGNFYTTHSELYDPVSGTWSNTGSLNVPRWHTTAAFLPSISKAMALGENTLDGELYDLTTGLWTPTTPLGVDPPYGETLTVLRNGKLLVASGDNLGSPMNPQAWIYDPPTETWSETASLHTGRYVHTATLLPDGKVLVAGGGGVNPSRLKSVETYNYLDPIGVVSTAFNGGFKLNFTNTPGAQFIVFIATNPTLDSSNWMSLGPATEITPGSFQFTDSEPANHHQRYYRVRAE